MAEQDDNRQRVEAAVQRCYSTWGATYYADYLGPNAPYPPVHFDLLRRLILDAGARSVLDAGCGPASFLRHLASDGLDLYGFDLTPEMVSEGRRVFAELSLDPERVWQGSVLDRASYRSPVLTRSTEDFDAAACIGVLPHVSEPDEVELFVRLRSAIRPGGLVVVEARNQLFSLFTVNRPSHTFVRDDLIRADELLAKAGANGDAIEGALADLKQRFRIDLPPIRDGNADAPGYDEVLSRTHNPLTLRSKFEDAGFESVRVLFYHFHALPPMYASAAPRFFREASVAMEDPEDWRGHFMASAFLLCGTRA